MYKTYSTQIRNLDYTQFGVLRSMCYESARLYNWCLYHTNKQYQDTKTYSNYYENYHVAKENEHYKKLPCVFAQETLKLVDRSFRSFFALLKTSKQDYRHHSINTPKYLPKGSHFVLVGTQRGFSIKGDKINIALGNYWKKEAKIKQISLPFPTQINPKSVKEIRIIPKLNGKYFIFNICYEVEENKLDKEQNTNFLSIDIGVNNLASCYDLNNKKSFIISGKRVKSINHFYNKQRAKIKSTYSKHNVKGETKKLYLITQKRNRRVKDYISKTSKKIIDYCLQNKVGTLVVGHNKGWKDQVSLGKRNNQNFVQIPFGLLMNCLRNKCQEFGLIYKEVAEHHTSKCSFLDFEEPKHQEEYLGKRIKRGLFKTSKGFIVNADINGAANILSKVIGILERGDQVKAALTQPKRFSL
jgi:putative transposase